MSSTASLITVLASVAVALIVVAVVVRVVPSTARTRRAPGRLRLLRGERC